MFGSSQIKMSVILDHRDEHKIKLIDRLCKNPWSCKWLDVSVEKQDASSKKVICVYRIGDYFRKLESAGSALCTLCNVITNYGNRGLVSLKEHVRTAKHHVKVQEKNNNHSLDSMFVTAKPKPLPGIGPDTPLTTDIGKQSQQPPVTLEGS